MTRRSKSFGEAMGEPAVEKERDSKEGSGLYIAGVSHHASVL
jgi:hypothetical protein